jgi:hypothetical protein
MAFTRASELKLRSTMWEIEEYKENIKSLEEELQYYRGEWNNVWKFKTFFEAITKYLHNLAT